MESSLLQKIWARKIVLIGFVFLVIVGSFGYTVNYLFHELKSVNQRLESLSQELSRKEESYERSIYEDHLRHIEKIKVESKASKLEEELTELSEKEENKEYLEMKEIYSLYNSLKLNLERNEELGLDVAHELEEMEDLEGLLLEKDFDVLKENMLDIISSLDDDHEEYLASLRPREVPRSDIEGYDFVTVNTERGSFGVHLVKVALSDVRVVTSSASEDTCYDNCPVKPLEEHIKDHGGYAGMSASYFCPPDYVTCANKTNSTDFAFYNSSNGRWLQKEALSWSKTGLATFKDSSAKFYQRSSDYGGEAGSAGLSNYPTLLSEGEVVVDIDDLTSYQTDIRGLRGAIGVDGSNLYLALVNGATVPESAYAMKALGARDALNLDGGASSALYINGKYAVGPGRELPIAIVLAK
ncbi:MAG: phosphodiester glycosidase family protein [Patescibacteria group bacterium]|nr:phosphodiester glycosidase family protein [Patescibacteria group bacterium]